MQTLMIKNRLLVAALAGILVVGAVGVALALRPVSPAPAVQAQSEIGMPQVQHWAEFSRAKTYSHLEELVRDSRMVIRGRATGYTTEYVDGAPAYVTDVVVEEVLTAAPGVDVHVGEMLKVRDVYGETGSDGVERPLYIRKTNWILFLTPFYFVPGVSTGQWISTGGPAGIFMNRLPKGDAFTRVDPESKLPAALDPALQATVRSSAATIGRGAGA